MQRANEVPAAPTRTSITKDATEHINHIQHHYKSLSESLSPTYTDESDINHSGYQQAINYCGKCNFRPQASKQGHQEVAESLESINTLKHSNTPNPLLFS